MDKEIGEIETLPYEIKQIEWRIPDFFAAAEDRNNYRYFSPSFSIADVSWYLSLWPNWRKITEEFIDMYLTISEKWEYSVEYYFGLKNCDGHVKQLVSGVMDGCKIGSPTIRLIRKTELLQRKSELMSGNNLTIVCTLKLMTEISTSSQPTTTLEKTKPQKLIRLDKLSENFKYLLGDKESCDTTLKVKDKEFKAHRFVLIARSSVLAATFKHDTLERQTGVINITDCDPDSFQEFLEYLYCGKLEELSFRSALNLYYTSDKYDVVEMKAYCIEYLMQCLTVENICEVVVLADKYEEAALLTAVQTFFNNNLCDILTTPEWDCLLEKDRRLANKLMIAMSRAKFNK